MPSIMDRKQKCKCLKMNLPKSGRVVIRCPEHLGKPSKSGRMVCYIGADGIVRQEGVTPRSASLPQKNATHREEFVYFLRVGDLIKIGYSMDPERRAADLQAELLGFAPGGRKLEAALHHELREYRERKEWYRNEPAVQIAMNKVLIRK